MRTFRLVVLVLTAGLGSRLDAQSLYGTVAGNVTDATSAVMAGVRVSLHNTDTGQYREGVTNESGQFSFSDVPTGTYDVSFQKAGFTVITRTGVPVTINNISRIDLAMQGCGARQQLSHGRRFDRNERALRRPRARART